MVATAALLAALAFSVAPVSAKDMRCGEVSAEDIQDIFDIILHYSGYDNDLDDQKPWGKPRRGPTRAAIAQADKTGDELYKVIGSPASAFAARTAMNKKEYSQVFIHMPSMQDINQNRGEVAFIIAHEMTHLVLHHPEQMEKWNMDSFMNWCADKLDYCGSEDSKKVVAAWDKAVTNERNAFIRDLEKAADREARQWITTIIDPRTDQTFGAEAGEEALRSAELWLKANGGTLDDPSHGSLASRVDVLRQDRELMERSRARSRALDSKVQGALKGSGL